VRRWLSNWPARRGPLFGFRGPSAPYWEFRANDRASADRGGPRPQPYVDRRRIQWVRFGWFGDDVWLLCEDAHAIRTMEATRRPSLAGKDLASALGFRPPTC